MNELFLSWYFTAGCSITLLLLLAFIISQRNEILSDIKDAINNPYSIDTLLMLILGIVVFIGSILLAIFLSPILLAIFLPILLINIIVKLFKS